MKNPSSLFSVRAKVVVVTGGSGQLGGHFIRLLTAAGARVASLDLKLKAGLRGVLQISTDVRSRRSVEAALDGIRRKWGVPHVLVNNAGVDVAPSNPAGRVRLEDFPVEEWRRVMDVNLTGVLVCSQVIGGAMAKARRGSIINIGSIYGLVSPDQRIYEFLGKPRFFKPVVYSASKSGINNLTRYMATYWGPVGVRVNTMVPGGIANKQDRRFLKGFNAKVPLGRMADVSELGGGLIYLASDASSYVTGSTLVIDGGYTAW